jgi:hypothetical protein
MMLKAVAVALLAICSSACATFELFPPADLDAGATEASVPDATPDAVEAASPEASPDATDAGSFPDAGNDADAAEAEAEADAPTVLTADASTVYERCYNGGCDEICEFPDPLDPNGKYIYGALADVRRPNGSVGQWSTLSWTSQFARSWTSNGPVYSGFTTEVGSYVVCAHERVVVNVGQATIASPCACR